METKEEKKISEEEKKDIVENPSSEEDKTDTKSVDKSSIEAINQNLIDEIKQIRKERAEAREKIEELEVAIENRDKEKSIEDDPIDNDIEEDVIQKKVLEVLKNKNKEKAKKNKKIAFERFIIDHKQFSPDNDPTGLKRDALENKFARFNTEDLSETEEFYSIIKEASALLGGNDTKPKSDNVENPYSSTPAINIEPNTIPKEKLTKEEQDVLERIGWTEERLLEVKKNKPDFYKSLFKDY